MQQDQQQQQQERQQREEDKERQQMESMRGARALSLFPSRCVPTDKNCHYILPDRGITLGGGYLQSRLLA